MIASGTTSSSKYACNYKGRGEPINCLEWDRYFKSMTFVFLYVGQKDKWYNDWWLLKFIALD